MKTDQEEKGKVRLPDRLTKLGPIYLTDPCETSTKRFVNYIFQFDYSKTSK